MADLCYGGPLRWRTAILAVAMYNHVEFRANLINRWALHYYKQVRV